MFFTVLSCTVSLLLMMGIGYTLRKTNIITSEAIPVLSGIMVNACMPCLLFMALQSQQYSSDAMKLIGSGALIYLLIIGLGFLVGLLLVLALKKLVPRHHRGIWIFAMMFPNVGYMGIPLIESIYGGGPAMFYMAIVNSLFNLAVFAIGTIIIRMGLEGSGRIEYRKILFNIPVIASLLGILFFVLGLHIPEIIGQALTRMGGMTTPIAMLIIGAVLSQNRIRDIFKGLSVYILCLMRLLVMPALVFLLLRPFVSISLVMDIQLILAATPVGVMTAVFAVQYKADVNLTSRFVFITTVLSIFTIPLVASVFL